MFFQEFFPPLVFDSLTTPLVSTADSPPFGLFPDWTTPNWTYPISIELGLRPIRLPDETFKKNSNKCNQCSFAFSRVDVLRKHLKMHSGEKSYKCNQCGYASSQAGNLRQHLKTHSGEKSNKCNQCDYASSQAGHLRRHLKKHSVEK